MLPRRRQPSQHTLRRIASPQTWPPATRCVWEVCVGGVCGRQRMLAQRRGRPVLPALPSAPASCCGLLTPAGGFQPNPYSCLLLQTVLSHFPTALSVDDYMSRVEVALAGYGFTGDNTIGESRKRCQMTAAWCCHGRRPAGTAWQATARLSGCPTACCAAAARRPPAHRSHRGLASSAPPNLQRPPCCFTTSACCPICALCCRSPCPTLPHPAPPPPLHFLPCSHVQPMPR
jgi:hypothetical protein